MIKIKMKFKVTGVIGRDKKNVDINTEHFVDVLRKIKAKYLTESSQYTYSDFYLKDVHETKMGLYIAEWRLECDYVTFQAIAEHWDECDDCKLVCYHLRPMGEIL